MLLAQVSSLGVIGRRTVTASPQPWSRHWHQRQVLQLAPQLVIRCDRVDVRLQAQHRQDPQVGAQGCARVAGLGVVQGTARYARALRHRGRGQLAAKPGQPQPLTNCAEQPLFLRKDDGRLARHDVHHYRQNGKYLLVMALNMTVLNTSEGFKLKTRYRRRVVRTGS